MKSLQFLAERKYLLPVLSGVPEVLLALDCAAGRMKEPLPVDDDPRDLLMQLLKRSAEPPPGGFSISRRGNGWTVHMCGRSHTWPVNKT